MTSNKSFMKCTQCFLQLVEEQFGADYELVPRIFKFAPGTDPAIKIKYPKKLDGWMLSRQSPRKVNLQHVHMHRIYIIVLQA